MDHDNLRQYEEKNQSQNESPEQQLIRSPGDPFVQYTDCTPVKQDGHQVKPGNFYHNNVINDYDSNQDVTSELTAGDPLSNKQGFDSYYNTYETDQRKISRSFCSNIVKRKSNNLTAKCRNHLNNSMLSDTELVGFGT